MKLIKIDLVVKDQRAGDLVQALNEMIPSLVLSGEIPNCVVNKVVIQGVPNRVMASLTTLERDELGNIDD